ncbi:ABC-type transport system substrate-binding protein [Bartonella fuyuanensis]|uniref:ABC-type transport system substrate-binding protein n=1 Tax=Bartonella fuyuanensis TaxID=1460968 RepID=A0A840DZ12_9HYPH|nr:ABC-type transport system substrate-binding protein [Bartonella fuyuanensis]
MMLSTPDEKTVVIKFDKPYPAEELILNHLVVISETVLLDRGIIMKHKKGEDLENQYLRTHAVCVGSYQLKRHPREAILLRASSNYWGQASKLKQILIHHVVDPGAQRLLLQKHDVDVARNFSSEKIGFVILNPQCIMDGSNTASVLTSVVFCRSAKSLGVKVRLAMRYLIDYEDLGKKIFKEINISQASFMPFGNLGVLDEKEGQPFKLDIRKAKNLLAEAGYPNGFEKKILVSNAPYTLFPAQSLQDSTAQAEIHLRIEHVAGIQFLSKINARIFDTDFVGWSNNSVDPHTMASHFVYNPNNRFEVRNTTYSS